MRIVTEKQVRRWADRNPRAAASLLGWLETAMNAQWSSLIEVRRTYAHADSVMVASGRLATVFNIAGNDYRLITAIHYNAGVIYTMMFLSHAEYSKNRWKRNL